MNTNDDMLQESVLFPHLDQDTGEDFSEDSEMIEDEDCEDVEPMDSADDADALASAGHGTDEDYGYLGDGDAW